MSLSFQIVRFQDIIQCYIAVNCLKLWKGIQTIKVCVFSLPGRFDEAISDMKEALSILPDFQPAQQCLEQAKLDKRNVQTGENSSAATPETTTTTTTTKWK